MAGSKFQYDESGGTFFYFLLSFLALLLIPSTYYLWPNKSSKENKSVKKCHCNQCQIKEGSLASNEPRKKFKQMVIRLFIIIGWLAFIATAYKVANLERDYVDFDPFEILQIDREASQAEIKKAYRKLSLVYHPDKDTGDARKFMKLTKAYAALTDEEAKRNWEMYGNPDGPGAMSFGIALPSWIVEKENSVWVLGLYALVFMIALPTVVGIWWYRSIKYGRDQVLTETSRLYYYFINKSPNMDYKRVLMVLSASMEFEKGHNNEIIERPSDNIEVPAIMKLLPNLNEKKKEPPLSYIYSVKARSLLHAHLDRLELPPNTLQRDKNYIVKKVPVLIQGMIQCHSDMTTLAHTGRIQRKYLPSVSTLENMIKLCPMFVQAIWDTKLPLLQLPHITKDMLLYHFINKKRNIRHIQQFIGLNSYERRSLLKTLTDDQYENVMQVCMKMPHIKMKATPEVVDEEEPSTITAGAIVTVTVSLERRNMEVLLGIEIPEKVTDFEQLQDSPKPENEGVKRPVWQKQQKKKGKKVKLKKKPVKVEHQKKKPNPAQNNKENAVSVIAENNENKEIDIENENDNEIDDEDSDSEMEKPTKPIREKNDNKEKEGKKKGKEKDEEEEDWVKLQNKFSQKEKILETKSKISHSVHCPYFPEDKQEFWWAYIVDKKMQALMTQPYHVTNLVDKTEFEVKFSAPAKPGVYHYSVFLRSDSYLDMDVTENFKLDVKKAKEVDTSNPQWQFSDDEEEKSDEGSETSGVTDDDDDDDDDDLDSDDD